jgi:hypothetical protein
MVISEENQVVSGCPLLLVGLVETVAVQEKRE